MTVTSIQKTNDNKSSDCQYNTTADNNTCCSGKEKGQPVNAPSKAFAQQIIELPVYWRFSIKKAV